MANEKQQRSGAHTRNSCLMRTIKKQERNKPEKTSTKGKEKNNKRSRAK